MLVDVADGLESKETFFFPAFLGFLDELEADTGPLSAHEVTVIHHVVSVLYVELDVCDVFYNDHVLGCMELHMTLIFEFLIILLHTSDFLFPHPLVILRLNFFELILWLLNIFFDLLQLLFTEKCQHFFLYENSDSIFSILNAGAFEVPNKIRFCFCVLTILKRKLWLYDLVGEKNPKRFIKKSFDVLGILEDVLAVGDFFHTSLFQLGNWLVEMLWSMEIMDGHKKRVIEAF